MTRAPTRIDTVTIRRIAQAWWPLAFSWLLMGVERPMILAVIARLPNPETHLASFGGLVGPLLDTINAPIIMLLAASTALSRDWPSYVRLRRYVHVAGLALTLAHILLAFTPLYYLVTRTLIHAPAETIEPARIALMISVPWSWAIAFRRFNQGVLIRFGHSRAIGAGTVVRIGVGAAVLAVAYAVGTIPGAVAGTAATICGVIGESAFIAIQARVVVREQLRYEPVASAPMSARAFVRFYSPLALTTIVVQMLPTVASAALSRMPNPIESLATWPVVSSLSFLLRSSGGAYNEVVVAMLDIRGALKKVRRFAFLLGAILMAITLVVAATPLARLWFGQVSGLEAPLVDLARVALWIVVPWSAIAALQSLYQGALVHSRQTHALSEAVLLVVLVSVTVMVAGMVWGRVSGAYFAAAAASVGAIAQTVWLWLKSRTTLQRLEQRDVAAAADLGHAAAIR